MAMADIENQQIAGAGANATEETPLVDSHSLIQSPQPSSGGLGGGWIFLICFLVGFALLAIGIFTAATLPPSK